MTLKQMCLVICTDSTMRRHFPASTCREWRHRLTEVDVAEGQYMAGLPKEVCMCVCMAITYSRIWIGRVKLIMLFVVS